MVSSGGPWPGRNLSRWDLSQVHAGGECGSEAVAADSQEASRACMGALHCQ